jgi:hypothetical protein
VGLDILINALQGCSEEYVGIKQLIIGGVNEDWPVDDALSPEVSYHSILCSVVHEQIEDSGCFLCVLQSAVCMH